MVYYVIAYYDYFILDNVSLYLQPVWQIIYPFFWNIYLNSVQYVGLTLESLRETHKSSHTLNMSD